MFDRVLMIFGAGAILAVGAFAYALFLKSPADASIVTIPLDSLNASQEVLGPEHSKKLEALKKPTPTAGQVVYACVNGRAFGVEYGKANGSAELTMDGGTSRLDPVFVAEGGEWSDGLITLVAKGDFAEVFFGSQSTSGGCLANQADAG